MRTSGTRASLLLLTVLSLLPSKRILSSPSSSPDPAPVGVWHAALVPTSEYPVYFDVRIAAKGKGLAASLVNGAVEAPFASAAWDGTTLTLALTPGDAKIIATRSGDRLVGRYARAVAAGVAEVPFTASRTAPALPPAPPAGSSVAGSWAFEIGSAPGAVETPTAVLTQKGAALAVALRSAAGDAGPLHGWFDGERLLLTAFDGVHVHRFDGELLPDGTLAGDLRSGTAPPVPWRARKLPGGAAGN